MRLRQRCPHIAARLQLVPPPPLAPQRFSVGERPLGEMVPGRG